jgi:RNA polymerase sigma-70 factor (ECF subfamily)
VILADQDPARWDADLLRAGRTSLDHAVRLRRPGPYQLQAAITALHVRGTEDGRTDWDQIAALYGALAAHTPSPVVEVNRAAAIGFADGPEAGLRALAPLLSEPALERYQPLHATHADLLRRSSDPSGAAQAYRRAIELSTNTVERAELLRRLHELPG